jgi:serine/threonine protein kinase
MVLDYFTGGELFFHLKNEGKFSEDRARLYAAEIVLALECIHKNDIIYRDLKPENILLDNEGLFKVAYHTVDFDWTIIGEFLFSFEGILTCSGHIRLTDFGLSKDSIKDNSLAHTFCGTPEYLAPEILYNKGHGKAVDWWSLGTLLYEMLTGLPPFYSTNINVMYEKILRAPLTFPPELSPAAASLLSGLIERDVNKRLGSLGSDADDIKSHPFFDGLDWNKLYNKEIEPPFKPKGAVCSKIKRTIPSAHDCSRMFFSSANLILICCSVVCFSRVLKPTWTILTTNSSVKCHVTLLTRRRQS